MTGLASGTLYYFALKAADEVSNWSVLSNVAGRATSSTVDTTPPAIITNQTAL